MKKILIIGLTHPSPSFPRGLAGITVILRQFRLHAIALPEDVGQVPRARCECYGAEGNRRFDKDQVPRDTD